MAHTKAFGPVLITLILSSLILCIVLVAISLNDFADDDILNVTVLSPAVAGLTVIMIMFGLQFETYNVHKETPNYASIFSSFPTIGALSVLWALWAVALILELVDYVPRTTRNKPYFDYNGGGIDQTIGVVAIQALHIGFVTSGMIAIALFERKRGSRNNLVPLCVFSFHVTIV
jgi:hypothetical protein